MKTLSNSQRGFFHPRFQIATIFCLLATGLTILGLAAPPPGSATATSAGRRVHRGVYRELPLIYVVKNGKAIFQGDIVLGDIETVRGRRQASSAHPNSLTVAYNQYLWPRVGDQFKIPYIIASGSGNLTNLNTAISQFNAAFSNIKFTPRTSETDYVNFYFDPSNNSGQCEATVGRAGGQQQVGGAGGSFNPCAVGTILHEMGHTVGLWHEQSRPDRDTYISVNYNNLIKGSISNFNQIFDNSQQTTLFDYASIMEYPPFSFSRNGGPAIESIPTGIPLSNSNGYTSADIDSIERLYGNAPTAVTVTSNPPGLQVIVDGLTVTTPQVFNWALNSNHTLDVPANVQSQAGTIAGGNVATTFYYTYGRWNDATAASHSITVLPGNGTIVSPTTAPAVTTYTANFIQLVPYAATVFPSGAGSVAPSPAPQSYPGSGLVFYTARQQATLTATPNSGQNFYEFSNAPFFLLGSVSANPKTFYVPDTGLTVNTTAEFSPNPVYTINVSPNSFSSNLYIYADGNFWYAPKNFSAFYDPTWTAGSSHTLNIDNPEYPYSFNSRYAFNQWSNGPTTTTNNIVLPASSTTYTANLTPQFVVTDFVNQSCAGSIGLTPPSPTGDGFYPAGSVLTFSETANAGWLFTGWQYDLSGTTTPKMLTVTDEVLVAADYNTSATPLALTSLSPSSVFSGNPTFTLTLNGTGFTPSSLVSVNGIFPAVNYINSTQLSVSVTAAQVATPGTFQVFVENFPSGASCAAFAALPFSVANRLTSIVSRMTHGGAGTFDVPFSITGPRGIECRSSVTLGSGNYTLIYTFLSNLASVAGASVTSHNPAGGTGSVLSSSLGPNANQYTVNLTNVSSGQYLTVDLTNVVDAAGRSGNVSGPQLGLLLGDTNGSTTINSADVSQTKSRSGQSVTGANFRSDVGANGSINSADVSFVKSKSGTALP